jgi:hypothetical protein
MEDGKGTDEIAREAFAFEPGPRPGGIDALKMVAAMKLMGEFEVMEDAEDRLDDAHEQCLLGPVDETDGLKRFQADYTPNPHFHP